MTTKTLDARSLTVLTFSMLAVLSISVTDLLAADPLPSWQDSEAKRSIIAYVEKVTTEGTDAFVDVEHRIAVFDNDGTLWCEYPVPNQAAFAFDEIQRMLPQHPEWKEKAAITSMLSGDLAALTSDHHKGLLQILALTHTGMTADEFDTRVANWLATAKHPRFERPYTETVYQPMLEVLKYLRANGFQTWIVSGGGQDFMRVFAYETYGIPPQQVIGSHGLVKYELKDGKPTFTKTLDMLFVDDKEGKPAGIQQFIGRRPIAAFGNSDGDQAMLEYTTINNPHPSFGLIVHHTDSEREYAYDANPKGSGKLTTGLKAAAKHGWTVVDMQQDWKQVFPETISGKDNSSLSLFGKWLAEDIESRGVIDKAQSTIEIAFDGTTSGSTCVNRYFGKATIDGTSIRFGPLATTRRAGPPSMMDQESRFISALGKVRYFRLDPNGLLFLLDNNKRDLLRFSRMNG
jgi:heat shock protein HslJ/phosphoserine phosphatase